MANGVHLRTYCQTVILVNMLTLSMSLDIGQCNQALGMNSGAITDENINASSSHSIVNVGPQNARLNRELNGGAWCPKRQITKDVFEFLEINLSSVYAITEVATQGRFGNGQGLEYAEKYLLEYWRPGLSKWIRFKNRHNQQVIEGNADTYTVVRRRVDPVIFAAKLRFVPYSTYDRTICMRVEIYGCPWNDGLLSYSMPQGERRGVDIDLADMVYDGIKDDSYLHGGLGQLTDGVYGEDNFRLDVNGFGKGYEWVGWKNDSSSFKPVTIIFEFDTVRNFSAAYFHCNNMYTKEVEVFSSARIYHSIGGKHFNEPPTEFAYMPDKFFERARNVTIHMYNRTARFLKVELHFASRWMLISEVSFSSVPVTGNFSEEEPPPPPQIVSTAISEDALSNEYVGLVIGVLAAVILLLILVILVIVLRNKRRKYETSHSMLKPVDSRVTVNMKDLGLTYSYGSPVTYQQNGSVYDKPMAIPDTDPDKLLYQEPQDFKYKYDETYSNAESTTSREYAIPDVTKTNSVKSLIRQAGSPLHKPTFTPSMPNYPPSPEHYYAAADISKLPNIQGVSGNNVYSTPSVDLLNRDDSGLKEIPRQKLLYIEKIGEGQFGEVHLCEAEKLNELTNVSDYENQVLVAVKILRNNSTDYARREFFKEVRVLASLRHANIVRLIGVCTKGEPMCMVVEYMENGDLNQFLQQCVPEHSSNAETEHSGSKRLSYGSLIYVATQIASGMKYLESLNFVHRDLASRNCLVGRSLTIKIADFGMSRDLYSEDYYRIDGHVMLPIRWMAWESILLGKFTPKSDVWSFAVTLWEILTFARSQPFSGLGDEKLIENASHFFHQDGKQIYLLQPAGCPKEIYDLMTECWQRNDHDRPKFSEIHLFLQCKNVGYSPDV